MDTPRSHFGNGTLVTGAFRTHLSAIANFSVSFPTAKACQESRRWLRKLSTGLGVDAQAGLTPRSAKPSEAHRAVRLACLHNRLGQGANQRQRSGDSGSFVRPARSGCLENHRRSYLLCTARTTFGLRLSKRCRFRITTPHGLSWGGSVPFRSRLFQLLSTVGGLRRDFKFAT